jgi:hypothetical protein
MHRPAGLQQLAAKVLQTLKKRAIRVEYEMT